MFIHPIVKRCFETPIETEDVPKMMYHYSDLETIKKAITNDELWAGSVKRFLISNPEFKNKSMGVEIFRHSNILPQFYLRS